MNANDNLQAVVETDLWMRVGQANEDRIVLRQMGYHATAIVVSASLQACNENQKHMYSVDSIRAYFRITDLLFDDEPSRLLIEELFQKYGDRCVLSVGQKKDGIMKAQLLPADTVCT